MSKTILVNVTAEDIARGVKSESSLCPIACALRKILLLGTRISVGVDDVGLYGQPHFHGDIDLPDEAGEWVQQYDKGLPVSPFTFTLEIPDAVQLKSEVQ